MREGGQKIRLGEVLKRAGDTTTISADREYREVTVRLWGRGVSLRGVVTGSEIAAARRFVAKAGQFIISRIDARNGAAGIVPECLDGAVVTNDFPLFDLDGTRLDAGFLGWFVRTPHFVRLCRMASEGTTNRVRLQEEQFLNLEIVLPPLEQQRRVVAWLDGVAFRISNARALRQSSETELRQMLRAAFFRVARGAPRRPMGEVAPLVRRPVVINPFDTYFELGIRSFGRGTFHKPPVSGAAIGNKRIFRIEPGDLLFSNVFAWEGAIAVAKPEAAGRVGSHRFITCIPQPGVVTAPFLRFFFLTDEGLELIGAASPGGAGRNRTLGLSALEAIRVPVPPIEEQHWFDALQAKADSLRELQAKTSEELDALLAAVVDRAFRNGSS